MNSLLDLPAALGRAHPGWQILREGPAWSAVRRPTPTARHVLVGPSFETLAAKLEQEDAA